MAQRAQYQTVGCKWCGAKAGEPCQTPSGATSQYTHAGREEDARQAKAAGVQTPNPPYDALVALVRKEVTAWRGYESLRALSKAVGL